MRRPSLLARLAASADPTQTVRLLADAELSRENAIYSAHLSTAGSLAEALKERNWAMLDELAARVDLGDDPEAAEILEALRRAARRDEHETELIRPLRAADRDALALVMSRTRPGTSGSVGGDSAGQSGPGPDSQPRSFVAAGVTVPTWQTSGAEIQAACSPVRIHARDVPAEVQKIRAAAEANPEAEFEITWRIVTP